MGVSGFLRTRFAGVLSVSILLGIGSLILVAFLGAYSRSGLIRVKTVSAQESTTQVFYDIGSGFNESDSLRYPNQNGVFGRTLLVPHDAVAVRIDPSENDLPIRFDRILIKPPGSWFLTEPDASALTPVHASWKNGIPEDRDSIDSSCVLIPDLGNADPHVVIREWKTLPKSPQANIEWMSHHPLIQFVAFFLISGMLLWGIARLFHLLRFGILRLFGCCKSTRFAVCRFNPLRYAWFRSAFPLSVLATLFLGINFQRENGTRYSIRFEITSPASRNLTVFADIGAGFTPRTSQSRTLQPSVHTRMVTFDFFSQQPVERFRVDPLARNGYARIENLRVRKGMGRWYPVDMADWVVNQAILIGNASSDSIEMLSTGDDPSILSVPVNEIFVRESNTIRMVRWSIQAFFLILAGFCLLFWIAGYGFNRFKTHWAGYFQWMFAQRSGFSRSSGSNRGHFAMISGCAALLWILLFYLFYPGALCGDTVTNMKQVMMGTLSSGDPPLLQHGIRLLQLITCSQWPMLAIQLGLHMGGFLLLSLYLLRKGQVMGAWFVIGLSVFPHIIYPHGMVLKDLLISGSWINMLALSLHGSLASTRRARVLFASIVALLGLLSVLSRDNTFLATPGLVALVMVPFSRRLHRVSASRAVGVVAALVLVVCGFGFMRVVNSWLLADVPNRDYSGEYFVDQIFTSDLIGMSIRSDHSGVTSRLSENEQQVFVGKYLNRPLFWIDDATFYSLFPNKHWIGYQWLESLINSPLTYARHRLHLFSKLFFRNRDLQMLWIEPPSNAVHFREALESGDCSMDTFLRPRSIGGMQWFSRYWGFMVRYFTRYSDWVLTGVLLLVPWMLVARGKTPTRDRFVMSSVWCSLSIALLYTVPNLFFVHHAETRYVYPALMMVFCSAILLVFCPRKADTTG